MLMFLVKIGTMKHSGVYFLTLGSLRFNDADDIENVKNTIGLISKTTTSHAHHTFLHDYDVKMPTFGFYGERKQPTTKFYFSF